jgi:rubredoxin
MKRLACKKCGYSGGTFIASQVCYHSIRVDREGNFAENEEVYQSERPYNFVCPVCSEEVDFEEVPDSEEAR